MQKRIMWSALFLALILLCGCSENGAVPNTVAWAEMPALAFGQLSFDRLDVLPWDSGRCESTSLSTMAETEKGHYFAFSQWLYFSDKADPDHWIPVCSNPSCTHYESCDARIPAIRFMISGDSIIYETSLSDIPVKKNKGLDIVLASKSLSGKFRKTEYILQEALTNEKSVTSSLLLPDRWLYQKYALSTEGTLSGRLYCVTSEGAQLIGTLDDFDILNTPPGIQDAASRFGLHGDRYFTSGILDSSGKTIFGFSNGKLTDVDISGLTLRGSYISGNTLRYFQPGEGYFDRDLKTGEEIFLAPPCLENSHSSILLPNCILESNMLLPASMKTRIPGQENRLAFFDGEYWHDVALPDSLKNAAATTFLTPLAINSDSVLLCCMDLTTAPDEYGALLFRIPLDGDREALEYMSQIKVPEMPEEADTAEAADPC